MVMEDAASARVNFPIDQDEQARQRKPEYLLAQDVFALLKQHVVHACERVKTVNNESDVDESRTHDAILINGKRGAGKSVILINLQLYLNQDHNLAKELLILKPIDPTLLERNDSLFLNIVVASVINDEHVKSAMRSNNSTVDEFHERLERLGNAFEGVERQREQFGMEKLRTYMGSIGLRNQIHHFFGAVLRMTNRKLIVMPIDDVDVALHFSFDQIEIVRRYLVTPYVLPIISGDLDLYHEIIWRNFHGRMTSESKISSYEARKNSEQLSLEYLRKVIPLPRRIELPELTFYLKDPAIFLSKTNMRNEDVPLLRFPIFKFWLDVLFNDRLNGVGGSYFPIPLNSIRDFSQLVTYVAKELPDLEYFLRNFSSRMEIKKAVTIFGQASGKFYIEAQFSDAETNKIKGKIRRIGNTEINEMRVFIEKWQDLLGGFFSKHSGGKAAALIFDANQHFRKVKNKKENVISVLKTDLFRPQKHDSFPSIMKFSSIKCDWDIYLQGKLPESWMRNIPKCFILPYPLPENGRPIVPKKLREYHEKIKDNNLSANVEFLIALMTYRSFRKGDTRGGMLFNGRLFELVILTLVADVNEEDIFNIINNPPFYSSANLIAQDAKSLGKYDGIVNSSNAVSSEIQEAIKKLVEKINEWRARNENALSGVPNSWFIYKLAKKFFSQISMYENDENKIESVGNAGENHKNEVKKIAFCALQSFYYLWSYVGALEKGRIFNFNKVIGYRNINSVNGFKNNQMYKQNIESFFSIENNYFILSMAYTYLLKDHPLMELFKKIYDEIPKDVDDEFNDNLNEFLRKIKNELKIEIDEKYLLDMSLLELQGNINKFNEKLKSSAMYPDLTLESLPTKMPARSIIGKLRKMVMRRDELRNSKNKP